MHVDGVLTALITEKAAVLCWLNNRLKKKHYKQQHTVK